MWSAAVLMSFFFIIKGMIVNTITRVFADWNIWIVQSNSLLIFNLKRYKPFLTQGLLNYSSLYTCYNYISFKFNYIIWSDPEILHTTFRPLGRPSMSISEKPKKKTHNNDSTPVSRSTKSVHFIMFFVVIAKSLSLALATDFWLKFRS